MHLSQFLFYMNQMQNLMASKTWCIFQSLTRAIIIPVFEKPASSTNKVLLVHSFSSFNWSTYTPMKLPVWPYKESHLFTINSPLVWSSNVIERCKSLT